MMRSTFVLGYPRGGDPCRSRSYPRAPRVVLRRWQVISRNVPSGAPGVDSGGHAPGDPLPSGRHVLPSQAMESLEGSPRRRLRRFRRLSNRHGIDAPSGPGPAPGGKVAGRSSIMASVRARDRSRFEGWFPCRPYDPYTVDRPSGRYPPGRSRTRRLQQGTNAGNMWSCPGCSGATPARNSSR